MNINDVVLCVRYMYKFYQLVRIIDTSRLFSSMSHSAHEKKKKITTPCLHWMSCVLHPIIVALT